MREACLIAALSHGRNRLRAHLRRLAVTANLRCKQSAKTIATGNDLVRGCTRGLLGKAGIKAPRADEQIDDIRSAPAL